MPQSPHGCGNQACFDPLGRCSQTNRPAGAEPECDLGQARLARLRVQQQTRSFAGRIAVTFLGFIALLCLFGI